MTIEQGNYLGLPEYTQSAEKADADEDMLLGEEDIVEEIGATGEAEEEMVVDDDDEGHEPTIIYTSEDDDGNGEEEQSISGLTQEEGGSFLAELTLHGGEPAYSMALHPRGNLVASAGGNDHAALFELSLASEEALSDGSGELLRVNLLADLSGHGDTVEHVQFSADGALLATGSLDGTVRIYSEETRTWTLKHILEGPTEVTWLNWHPKGPVLAAGSADGAVWMWEASKGACMQVFKGMATSSTTGRFSPDGRILISAGEGVITVWNPKTGAALVNYAGNLVPPSMAISLACHPSRSIAAVGFTNGSVLVIHCEHHQILATLLLSSPAMGGQRRGQGEDEEEQGQETEPCSVEQIAFVPGQPIMVAANFSGLLYTFDSNTWKMRSERPHPAGITSARLSGDASTVIVGCLDGSINLWDVRSGERLAHYRPPTVTKDEDDNSIDETHDNAVYDTLELPHLSMLLASFDDGKIRILPR